MELIGCPLAIMQISLPSWLFEHSDPMSLCACLDALMARVVPHALGKASVMYINTKVIACLHVYQAALMRRMHVCRLYYYAPSLRCCRQSRSPSLRSSGRNVRLWDNPLPEVAFHINGQSDSSLKRIIPEPHVPSRGSQARGTRLCCRALCGVNWVSISLDLGLLVLFIFFNIQRFFT